MTIIPIKLRSKQKMVSKLKFRSEQLFTGLEMLDETQVLVTNDQGVVEGIVPAEDAGDDVQLLDGIISPGFINTHCHLELSHLKNVIPEGTGLVDFVMGVMHQRNFAEETILAAIEAQEQVMYNNGIVAVGDICNTAHSFAQKQKGKLHYYNFIEVSGFVPQFADKRFEQGLTIYNQATDKESSAIVPHAPYSTSLQLMQLVNEHSKGKVITIHNQETKEEEDFFITGDSKFRKLFDTFNIDISFYKPYGQNSLRVYLPYLNKASSILLVHNTFTTLPDVQFALDEAALFNHDLYWALCVNANLYIEKKLPPVYLLRDHECTITLGTDSLASNHGLSILEEIKTIRKNFPEIELEEILQWATYNGAKALQMSKHLGSFEKGKQPGVLLMDENLKQVKRLV